MKKKVTYGINVRVLTSGLCPTKIPKAVKSSWPVLRVCSRMEATNSTYNTLPKYQM